MLLTIAVILIIVMLQRLAISAPEEHRGLICLLWQDAPTGKGSGRVARSTGA